MKFAAILEVHGDEILIRLPLKQRGAPLFDIPKKLILTPRQHEVFAFLTQGKSNKAIAAQMGLTERGVKFHVSGLMRKLGIESRHEVRTIGRPIQ